MCIRDSIGYHHLCHLNPLADQPVERIGEEGVIRLCYGDVTGLLDPAARERCLAFIPRECREKLLKMRSDRARAGSLGARLLLARCLEDMGICLAEEAFVYGTFGKPSLRDHPQIFFNLTHSGVYAACAVSDLSLIHI